VSEWRCTCKGDTGNDPTCPAHGGAAPQPRHEFAGEYTGPPEIVTLSDGRQGVAPAWMADVLRCAGMAS
jgi:hypothetical protein